MAAIDFRNPPIEARTAWQTRTYVYYSRYPAVKTNPIHVSWRTSLHRIWMYFSLVMIGVIMTIVGGIFPVWLSYEMVFKPLVNITCEQCQVVMNPYFEFDYVFASILGVMGFTIPIIVLYLFIKIMRNRTLRHDLFH